MRPVPPSILILLLLAMCGLCAVQWWRESGLREIAVTLRSDLATMTVERDRLNERAKSADAEILRLTAAFTDLRSNSVSRDEHAALLQILENLRCQMDLQNSVIAEQNAAVKAQGLSTQNANEIIRKLVAERDGLAARVNEVTARYNALIKKP